MKHTICLLAFMLTSYYLQGQISYSGFIDKYPIEMVTDVSTDGDARAIYAYSNVDEPIVLNGTCTNGTLTLYEKDATNVNRAMLTFDRYDAANSTQEGVWTNLKTKKELKITLTKAFELSNEDSLEWPEREILQPVFIDNTYFKLLVSKKKGESPAITGVKILERKTDRLLQKIEMNCQLMGLDNISVGDYNFDGITDFSVFEQSYAGPNTSSLYFLFDPGKGKYVDSGYDGVSLEFDNKVKRIYERNSSCAGEQQTSAVYKVVRNKMVLLEKHCFVWNEKKQKLVERKMKDCE